MTGTVLDGNIDVALLRTDGESIDSFGRYTLAPYSASTLSLLRDAVDAANQWQFEGPAPTVFAKATEQLTREQSAAVTALVTDAGLFLRDVGVVGFHGQTVLHKPPTSHVIGQTLQLGDGALMSRLLERPVVHDFRSADMRAGGQGAPLSAIYHQALLSRASTPAESAVLNLGGVANLTWWDGDVTLLAFDTGPANAPINDFVRSTVGQAFDKDGALAAAGVVDEKHLAELLEHPYFTAQYPKSLDRYDFSSAMADGLSVQDGAALLTAFSAAAVDKALTLLPERPTRLIVCGGGRHNPTLMSEIANRTRATVVSAEAEGWRGDAVEAECFAYLAVRSMRGLPLSFPSTTGASSPVCGGVINMPDQQFKDDHV